MRGRFLALFLVLLTSSGIARASGCEQAVDIAGALRGAASEAAQAVRLPDFLPLALRHETAGVHYELDVGACASAPAAALWLFRVGAPYRVTDTAGKPLALLTARGVFARRSAASPELYNGRIPAVFALPPGTQRVSVQLQTLPYLPAGIVRAQVGPANLLLRTHAAALDDVVAHADVASGVVLVLGALALLLWLPRRRDRSLLWLAVACGLWGVRGIVYFGPGVLMHPSLFEQLNPFLVLLTSAALTASVLSLQGRFSRRWSLLLATSTSACLVVFAVAHLASTGALAARGLALVVSTSMLGALLGQLLARRRAPGRRAGVLAAGVTGLLLCAAHDVLVIAGRLPPDEPSYVFWGFVALLVGFAAITGQYVVTTLNRAERSNEELEEHVARKTSELEQSYSLLRESEREAARTQERGRLLRDMHDGLGAQLMTALRGVERGALGPQQVAQSLQDGLDELRMLMDSTDMGHYLPGALAAWRNRWDARIAAAGIQLHWNIDESLDDAQVPGDSTLQLLRILQEASTNVVKHAKARHLRFDARVEAGTLRITIADDGVGLPAEDPRAGARGLGNMRHRALQVGAQLAIGPPATGTGTQLVLLLPLQGTAERAAVEASGSSPGLAASRLA